MYKTIQDIVDILFGLPTIYFFLLCGLFFTVYLGIPQIRYFWHALRIAAGRYAKLQDFDDEPSIIKSISISIANPIGLGSIAGVALALTLGGPGAIFWMVIAGLAGMAIKIASIAANLSFQIPHPDGKGVLRGPYVLISTRFSNKFSIFALIYAIFVLFASLSAGNLFQTNQIGAIFKTITYHLPHQAIIIGLVMMVVTAITLFRFKRLDRIIANFAPVMATLYLIFGIYIICINYSEIPEAIALIFNSAFSYQSAGAGAMGVGLREIMTNGIRRGLFAGEAGIGAHSIMKRPEDVNPVQQGIAGMLGSFFDTVFTCFLTALIIFSTGVWDHTLVVTGIELPALAFTKTFGVYGFWGVVAFVIPFAFSTMLIWYSNGKHALGYIFKNKKSYHQARKIYKVTFILVASLGPILPLMLIINLSDLCFAAMLIINMVAVLFLSKGLKERLKKYRRDLKAERV